METKRGKKIYGILGLILTLEMLVLFWNSGLVAGINQRADCLKTYAIASRDDATILPGDIYDRNGELLAETVQVSQLAEDQKSVRTVRRTSYANSRAYSQLIGYTGSHALSPLADSVEKVVGNRRDYRLMAFLDEDYWGKNGIYSTVDIDGTKGQSAVLTIDNALQNVVYRALQAEMDESAAIGSAVVMDAGSGEILSMVSFPTYDFNNLSEALEQMGEDEKNTNLEPGYPVSYKKSMAPGSIFKLLTAVSLIDHGLEDFEVEDRPFQVDGWKCSNAYTSQGELIGYETALERSSNVYFARAALELGRERLGETAEKFMLKENVLEAQGTEPAEGQDTTYLSLDFGDIQYNWDLDVRDSLLAQTGFGQGKTELSTVFAAMIVQAIANDGKMMQPYLIKELVDADGRVVYKGKEKILSKATSKATADKVTEAMVAAAAYGSTHHKNVGNAKQVFETWHVAGKTGTAENGDREDTNNAWFVSFAPAEDPQYVVVVNQGKCEKGGYRMMQTAAAIYEYLFQTAQKPEE